MPTENCNIWNFPVTCSVYILMKCLQSYKKCEDIEIWRGLGWIFSKDLVGQAISDKIFCQKLENQVKLDKTRKASFDGYCQKLIFGRETGYEPVSTKFWDFLFLIF